MRSPEYTRRRPVRLPGLTLLPRARARTRFAGTCPHLDGLHFSGRPRAFLDNMRPSRARDGISRTLSTAEVEDELTRIATIRGRDALGELRDQAREIAEARRRDAGAGSPRRPDRRNPRHTKRRADHPSGSRGARRARLRPAPDRAVRGPARSPAEGSARRPKRAAGLAPHALLPRGLLLELDRGDRVRARKKPRRSYSSVRCQTTDSKTRTTSSAPSSWSTTRRSGCRPQMGRRTCSSCSAPTTPLMLERRPQVHPGVFKTRVNRAGATTFVHPDLVVGTLVEGYRYYRVAPRRPRQGDLHDVPDRRGSPVHRWQRPRRARPDERGAERRGRAAHRDPDRLPRQLPAGPAGALAQRQPAAAGPRARLRPGLLGGDRLERPARRPSGCSSRPTPSSRPRPRRNAACGSSCPGSADPGYWPLCGLSARLTFRPDARAPRAPRPPTSASLRP